jgi:hypothetical protein
MSKDNARQGTVPPDPTLLRIMTYEFDAIARGLLDDDPDAAEFHVIGPARDTQANGLRLAYAGVPEGAQSHPNGYWMPDRQAMIELLARTWQLRSCRWNAADRKIADPDRSAITSLRQRWPATLDCPFSCGVGWIDLIEATARWLDERGELLPFSDVSQKYGGLRLSGGAMPHTQGFDLVLIAEHMLSEQICETCGAPGRLIEGQYIATLCDRHLQSVRS